MAQLNLGLLGRKNWGVLAQFPFPSPERLFSVPGIGQADQAPCILGEKMFREAEDFCYAVKRQSAPGTSTEGPGSVQRPWCRADLGVHVFSFGLFVHLGSHPLTLHLGIAPAGLGRPSGVAVNQTRVDCTRSAPCPRCECWVLEATGDEAGAV